MRIESSIGFDLSAIEVFVAVCETKSMVKASQKLQLTESAVSHSIRSMEAKLGLDLFDRTFRPLKPTAMGLHLLERGRRLLSEASSISGDLKAMGQVAYSQLRVGVIESMSTWSGPCRKRLELGSDHYQQRRTLAAVRGEGTGYYRRHRR